MVEPLTKKIFRNPALLGMIVKHLYEKDKNKQIGKAFVQNMAYLLTRESVFDFDYSLYHYGPRSMGADNELSFAWDSRIVNMEWREHKGY